LGSLNILISSNKGLEIVWALNLLTLRVENPCPAVCGLD
jgi:hypothetical protein